MRPPGDPAELGGADQLRRRRLTFAQSDGSLPSLLTGSRFSCLPEPVEEEDGDSDGALDHVAVQVAEAAIEDYPVRVSTPVVRRPKKTDAELLAEFWADASFASPSSRFWEKSSTPGATSQGKTPEGSNVRRFSAPSSPVRCSSGGHASGRGEPRRLLR
jgi:hypothetical protein